VCTCVAESECVHARASVFANVCTWQGGEAERYFETNKQCIRVPG